MRWGAAAAVLVLALTGCGGGQPVTGGDGPGPSSASTGATSTAAYLQARRDAGIADCPSSEPARPAPPGGLPEVSLECFGGGSTVRLAGLTGRPRVVNVWAQWCGPCRQEAPYLAEYAARAGDRVELLGIDYADPDPAAALEFARRAGWRYPQLVDPQRAIAPGLSLTGVPQTFLVDANGVVVHRHTGPVTSTDQLAGLVAEHLGVRA